VLAQARYFVAAIAFACVGLQQERPEIGRHVGILQGGS
jgi:hypothetical protein